MKILEKILEFNNEIGRQFEGGCQDYSFQKEWNKLAVGFRASLVESQPVLVMSSDSCLFSNGDGDADDRFASPLSVRPRTSAPSIHISSDDDENLVESPCNKKRRHAPAPNSTPRKKPALATESQLSQIPMFEETNKNPLNRTFAHKFRLDEIRSIIQDAHIGLPGQTDPRAIDRMIRMSMQSWDVHLHKFMTQTEELCLGMVRAHVDSTFAHWRSTRLFEKFQNICEVFVKERMNLQRQAADRARILELHKPMTFNSEAVELAYTKARAKTQEGRQYFRAKEFVMQHMKDFSQKSTPDEKITKVLADKRLGPDEWRKEVEIMGVSFSFHTKCQRKDLSILILH